MCGIIGYIGHRKAVPIVLEGLKKLEYRGYDSSGIAVLEDGALKRFRAEGKIRKLEEKIHKENLSGNIALGHTRWATHGKPSEENAHPHTDCSKRLVVVHNGIIENYLGLKTQLISEGHKFESETDTEVIAHLIEDNISKGLLEALRMALDKINGSYALAVIGEDEPDKIVVARSKSPLIIGLGKDENFVGSDVPAFLNYSRQVVYLEDGEIGVLRKDKVKVYKGEVERKFRSVSIKWDSTMAEKVGFDHFMLKEICEQPRAIEETIRGRAQIDTGKIYLEEFKQKHVLIEKLERLVITACGTSWHAGLVGKYLIEDIARIPVEVDYAAEFRYRNPIIAPGTVLLALSQSGETADTLAAIEEARKSKCPVVSICNVVGSSIARESDVVLYTHAGPEIGVASTKAFTTQLVVLYLLAINIAQAKGFLKQTQSIELVQNLRFLVKKADELIGKKEEIQRIARKYYQNQNFLYLGRGKGFPVALEGALKLKEVSYIHAEGYPAAEMKHGPIALIDKNMPVVVLALKGRRYEKMLGNIEEIKSRGGRVIVLTDEESPEIKKMADDLIVIPHTSIPLSPVLAVIPLQLLAYYIAVLKGCDVDQPRNLAKSVTVE